MDVLKRLPEIVRTLRLDIRYGGLTGGVIEAGASAQGAKDTVSTRHDVLEPLLGPVLRRGDVFVDVGCGKGRVLNWVIDTRRCRMVYGAEINKAVAGRVAKRLKDHPNVTVIAGDALSAMPDEATVFYLWHPFDEHVMARFKEVVHSKYSRLGTLSDIRIVYHNAQYADVWLRDSRCKCSEIALPKLDRHRAILIRFQPN